MDCNRNMSAIFSLAWKHKSKKYLHFSYWNQFLHCVTHFKKHPVVDFYQHWTQRPKKKKNCARQNEREWHSSGMFTALIVKCQMVRLVGRWAGWEEGASSSITLLRLSSAWYCAWDSMAGWAAGSIIRERVKNGVSTQGDSGGSRPNLTGIILRLIVVTISAKDDFCTGAYKPLGATQFSSIPAVLHVGAHSLQITRTCTLKLNIFQTAFS